MEFVIVRFPTVRNVNMDGAPQGKTDKLLRVQAGTHRFDLGVPPDYTPGSQTRKVIGTTMASPMEILFTRASRAAAAGRRKPRRRAATSASSRRKRKAPAKRAPTIRSGAPGVTGITF